MGQAAIARATISSLNGQRSSSEPPPRQNGGGDLLRGSRSLNANGIDLQRETAKSAAEDVEDVADRGSCSTGYYSDALRQLWNRFLPRDFEEPFVRQSFFQLLEGQLQCAQSGRLEGHGRQLEVALLFVDRQAAAHDQLQPVLDSKPQEARVRIE